ncbi:MBL fold metallo-hydrolase [Desulfonatronum thioautotrophicum]|uniref:MBL fold metallo-hydrolase n=1 Tax=Desulfonatronum thioautotrophicum TaxID=617001 RepID=UPI0005EACDAA|nr:MBL fold metallo-hydrolase [Desulfonatronum thioautotrophicum]
MRIYFLGVGEAFDEFYPNTSLLIYLPGPSGPAKTPEEGGDVHVLLDCGFTAPTAYYRYAPRGADEKESEDQPGLRGGDQWVIQPDVIWISHFHGDHFLGLPLMLLRFWEEGRKKMLTIFGPEGVESKVWSAFELAYPGFRERIDFPIVFLNVGPEMSGELLGMRWSTAANAHSLSAPCLTLRLDHAGKSLVYSGDGRPTSASERLAQGADLLVHEAYALEGEPPGHGTVARCLELAGSAGVKHLALVHVQRKVRAEKAEEIRALLNTAEGVTATLPEPGTVIVLET